MMKRTTRTTTPTLPPVLALALTLASAPVALGQPPEPKPPASRAPGEAARPAEPSRGAVLYRLHCAACHGVEGRGNGPVAGDLETPPPDLTRIAARRGGRFSATELEGIIDGRIEVAQHGRSEMPVWGLSFRQPGRIVDQEEEVWLQIKDLVAHLESIQTQPARTAEPG